MTESPGSGCNNGVSLKLQGAARKLEHTKRKKKGEEKTTESAFLFVEYIRWR